MRLGGMQSLSRNCQKQKRRTFLRGASKEGRRKKKEVCVSFTFFDELTE